MKKESKSILLVLLLFSYMWSASFINQKIVVQASEVAAPRISFKEFMNPMITEPVEPKEVFESVDITLTRYYPGAGGSDLCTATKCVNSFEVNEKGWYTYQGKIVIGAATYACQKYCKYKDEYGPLPDDYRIFNFYDEIQFMLEGTVYIGIVLDSCGACMYHINGEQNQRYDIYTVDGTEKSSLLKQRNVGKTSANLIVESLDN